MKKTFFAVIFASVTFSFFSCKNKTESMTYSSFPTTAKKPLTDEYHGVKVVDNYRWLDDLNDPVVKKWNDEQNQYTRSILDQAPSLGTIQKRLQELYSDQSTNYYGLIRRRKVFAMKEQPPKNQPFLITMKSFDDPQSEQVIVDPNVLNPSGTTTIDWFVPSLDGKLVAVSMSENGSEDGSVHVFEVATGKKLPDVIPRVQYATGGGDVAWNKETTGFYYTRYPQGNERPLEDANFYQQVYFHQLGTPASADTYVLGKEFPRIAEIQLDTTPDGRYHLATVANGDGGEFNHYVLNPAGQWTQVTQFSDQIKTAVLGGNDWLYLLSYENAPMGKILAVPLSNPQLFAAKIVIPESAVAIESIHPTTSRLYVVDNIGGPSQIRVFDRAGNFQSNVPLPPIASVNGVIALENNEILFSSETYLTPRAWYHFNPFKGEPIKTALANTSNVNFDDTEVVREFATSKDGTKVPLNIIRRKGTQLNGQNPTILYGYGGYNISLRPGFSAQRKFWLENGGVFVVANLRGGGEYGEAWHRAGNLTRKQNVFDDFAASAQYLIDEKYTNPNKLAIEGGSNGGLLMGAALTQHPELFRAVVSHVGIYDMLRVELFPNGAFNVTEFGTVKDPEQFKALYAYSPYHHVDDGKAYPAVLFLTGDHDGRVDPANSRKMTARLQAATSSGLPILLRTNSKAGHGAGTSFSDRVLQDADVFAFLFEQLGIDK